MKNIKIYFLITEDQKDSPTELAFKYAVYRINKNREILPNHNLVYDIQVGNLLKHFSCHSHDWSPGYSSPHV